jgi:hypothetical protein
VEQALFLEFYEEFMYDDVGLRRMMTLLSILDHDTNLDQLVKIMIWTMICRLDKTTFWNKMSVNSKRKEKRHGFQVYKEQIKIALFETKETLETEFDLDANQKYKLTDSLESIAEQRAGKKLWLECDDDDIYDISYIQTMKPKLNWFASSKSED